MGKSGHSSAGALSRQQERNGCRFTETAASSVSYFDLLCCVVLCCVVLCCAMLCCAMLCCAMLCYVVLCSCVVLCYATVSIRTEGKMDEQ